MSAMRIKKRQHPLPKSDIAKKTIMEILNLEVEHYVKAKEILAFAEIRHRQAKKNLQFFINEFKAERDLDIQEYTKLLNEE